MADEFLFAVLFTLSFIAFWVEVDDTTLGKQEVPMHVEHEQNVK
ncbi:MAG: hypothetical protein ACTSSE_12315 [Candidatus Thorarchaeota archaeon]